MDTLKTISIPTSWDDIKLKTFEELVEASNDKTLDMIDRELLIVSILTGLSVRDVSALDMKSYNTITSKIHFLTEPVPKYMPKDSILINGTRYHVDLHPGNIIAQQFLDYKLLIQSKQTKLTARLCACFMYPEGHEYNDGYDIDKVVDDIWYNLAVPEVTALTSFFMEQYRALSIALVQYSIMTIRHTRVRREQRAQKKQILKALKLLKASIRDGGYSELSTLCQKLIDAVGTMPQD